MKTRCFNPKHKFYRNYGGRGIKVCRRWRRSFANFLADVGPKPSPELSIDRYADKNGHYSCGKCKECVAEGWSFNVRWATDEQQARNTRGNRLLTHDGETLTVTEWSERTGIGMTTILFRLFHGWTVDKALTTPPRDARIKFRGLCLTTAEWGRRTGIGESAIRHRLSRGWTVAETLTTPLRITKRSERFRQATGLEGGGK
jgi:hypothetical protein